MGPDRVPWKPDVCRYLRKVAEKGRLWKLFSGPPFHHTQPCAFNLFKAPGAMQAKVSWSLHGRLWATFCDTHSPFPLPPLPERPILVPQALSLNPLTRFASSIRCARFVARIASTASIIVHFRSCSEKPGL